MEDRLTKARQAFKAKFGAMPEQQGFNLLKEDGDKIIFAKNRKVFSLYVAWQEIKKQKLMGFLIMTALFLVVWFLFAFFWRSSGGPKLDFLVMATFYALTLYGFHAKKSEQEKKIKESWKDQLVVYDAFEGSITEPK